MLSALGVPAAPALPAALVAYLGAGKVDPMDNVLSGGIIPKKQSSVWLLGSMVGCGEHPEMGMLTV